ncbi:MAG: radical SAM protein [Fidelibacterota bacterium]
MDETYIPIQSELISEYNQFRSIPDPELLCYAPFKSIRFAHNGYALACCHNRYAVLGKYPEQSVDEIWFGEKAQKLRRYIKENDLSMGCQKCKRNIENRAFGSVDALKFDYAVDLENGEAEFPILMEFQIDNTCNLECIQCRGDNSSSIRKNRDHLPPYIEPYDDQFVDQLSEFLPYVKKIGFAGGEPLLGKINQKIWERCIELNPKARINVMTNGTTLNPRFKKFMDLGNFHISVSIDSMVKQSYEMIRLNSNLDQVMRNIEYYIRYSQRKDRHFSLHTCFMSQNWQDIPEILEYCNYNDLLLYFHIVYFPTDCSVYHLPQKNQKEILNHYLNLKFENSSPNQSENIKRFDSLITLLKSWLKSEADVTGPKLTIDNFDLLELEDYKSIVTENIQRAVNSDHILTEDEKKYHLIKLVERLDVIFNGVEDEDLLKSALYNISKLPARTVLTELEIAPLDSLIEMVKTAGRKTRLDK